MKVYMNIVEALIKNHHLDENTIIFYLKIQEIMDWMQEQNVGFDGAHEKLSAIKNNIYTELGRSIMYVEVYKSDYKNSLKK